MRYLRQFVIILFIAFIGEILNKIFNIPIPGNILGMVLLLFALIFGIVKLDYVDEVSKFLLENMSVIFVPAGVGLLSAIGIIKGAWWILMVISIFTTILVMALTGIITEILRRQ